MHVLYVENGLRDKKLLIANEDSKIQNGAYNMAFARSALYHNFMFGVFGSVIKNFKSQDPYLNRPDSLYN